MSLPEDMRERVKANIVNAYSLGCGNTMTGNKINEHEDLESYTKTVMALLEETDRKAREEELKSLPTDIIEGDRIIYSVDIDKRIAQLQSPSKESRSNE